MTEPGASYDTPVEGAASAGAAEDFWDGHYRRAAPRADLPRMNAVVAGAVAALAPGRALDLGCGEGGDSLGLAALDWQVTAVDVSATAVRRVRERAQAAGLAGSVTVEQHDLTRTVPAGPFDLVSAAYLQSPVAMDRAALLRAAAGAVAAAGLMLVVDHGSTMPWSWNQDPDTRYPTPEELFAGIGLPPDEWRPERLDAPTREATGPGGQVAVVTDTVVVVRRLPSP